jgi:DNA-binding PadR family transcriptional regulator
MDVALTPPEAAILGLIAQRPRHGYELDETIEARGLREWSEIGFSSIYFHLQKLQKKGLIRRLGEEGGEKSRKPYATTKRGLAALGAKAEEMLACPQRLYPPLLVGLANWPILGDRQGNAALARRKETLKSEQVRIASVRDAQQPLPSFVDAMFDYSLAMIEAELGWIDRRLARN